MNSESEPLGSHTGYNPVGRGKERPIHAAGRLFLFAVTAVFLTDFVFALFMQSVPESLPVVESFFRSLALFCVLSPIFYFYYYRSSPTERVRTEQEPAAIETSPRDSTFEEIFYCDKTSILLSPKRLLPLMILSIFIAETTVMFMLSLFEPLPIPVEALVDSSALLVILSPTFFFLHYQPLKNHNRERMKIARQLFASEQRFQMALKAVNDSLWDYNPQTKEIYVSPQSEIMLGYIPGELGPHIGHWKALLHPEEVDMFIKAKNDHLSGLTEHIEVEHRFRTKNGDWLWFLTRGQVVARDREKRPLRVIGTHTNITQRKQAEAALRMRKEEIRKLSHKLIHAAEDEKKRLAQDLHDEFGQVLTAFQIGLEMLRDQGRKEQNTHDQQCDRLLNMVQRLETDLRSICDQLRPVILDDLGLMETMRWHISQFVAIDDSFDVDFQVSGQQELSRELTIVLYRIFQEALNNIHKHASPSQVRINLDMKESQIELTIRDDGRGFENKLSDAADRTSWGLGLIGMRERATAVGGDLSVVSGFGQGTIVRAILPTNHGEGL